MKKRLLAYFLTVVMLMGILPTAVLAASDPSNYTFDISEGNITVTSGESPGNIKVTYGDPQTPQTTEEFVSTQAITVTGSTTQYNITVSAGVSATLILSGISIDVSSIYQKSAIDLSNAGACTIQLAAGTENVLKAGEDRPGIHVPKNQQITFTGAGSLNVTGGTSWPGIGTNGDGNILIESGTITAQGGSRAAGIGGSWGNHSGGTITISGGTVNTTGGHEGAGIGGGTLGSGGIITISGGTVNATGGSYGAGIGGGTLGSGGTFSTGEEGSAFIIASSIGDSDDKTDWSGVIIEGNTGKVYGDSVTLTTDAEIPEGTELTIADGQTLTIADGVTLTNSGTLTNNGMIDGSGTIAGAGAFSGNQVIPTLSEPKPSPVTYGAKLSDITLDVGWTWEDGDIVPTVKNSGYQANYAVSQYGNPEIYDWSKIAGYDSQTGTVTRTIVVTVMQGTQAALSITGAPATIYNGDSFTLTVSGGSGAGAVTWGIVSGPATVDADGKVTVTGAGEIQIKAVKAADDNYTQAEAVITLNAVRRPSSSGSGGYTPPTYPPMVEQPSEGGSTPSTSPSNPKQGDTVTVTPKPDEGYEVDTITVTDKNGRSVEVTKNPDGTYTFQQPSGKVTIKVTYKSVDTPWNSPFADVSEGDWYYEAVRFVSENGLMDGYGGGLFGPNDTLSRAQLCQILFNKEGGPGVNYLLDFSDVADGAWYTEAVRWATSQGIVGGYGGGLFGPNDPITREQLAAILWRYAGSPAAANKELHFNDESEISPFALEAMRWAVENGILSGDGSGHLNPKGNATRAHVAQLIKNFIQKLEENI